MLYHTLIREQTANRSRLLSYMYTSNCSHILELKNHGDIMEKPSREAKAVKSINLQGQ